MSSAPTSAVAHSSPLAIETSHMTPMSQRQPLKAETADALMGIAPLPDFINKLMNIMKDPQNMEYVFWDEAGMSIIIKDKKAFAEVVIPRYFQHRSFSSFERQLNMYDFTRQSDGRRYRRNHTYRQICQFSHPFFQRDKPELLRKIVRKIRSPRPNPTLLRDGSSLPGSPAPHSFSPSVGSDSGLVFHNSNVDSWPHGQVASHPMGSPDGRVMTPMQAERYGQQAPTNSEREHFDAHMQNYIQYTDSLLHHVLVEYPEGAGRLRDTLRASLHTIEHQYQVQPYDAQQSHHGSSQSVMTLPGMSSAYTPGWREGVQATTNYQLAPTGPDGHPYLLDQSVQGGANAAAEAAVHVADGVAGSYATQPPYIPASVGTTAHPAESMLPSYDPSASGANAQNVLLGASYVPFGQGENGMYNMEQFKGPFPQEFGRNFYDAQISSN